MAGLLEPLLALVGDLVDPSDPNFSSLETAQGHLEGLTGGEGKSERSVAEALLSLAGLRIHLHRTAGARNTLGHLATRFRGQFPGLDNLADYAEARLLLEEGRYDEALEALDGLRPEHRDPRARRRLTALGHYLKGMLLIATGQEPAAHFDFRRAREALQVGPPQRVDLALTAEVWNAEGEALARMDQPEAARAAFRRAGEAAEKEGFVLSIARSLRGRGLVHHRLGEREPALTCLEEALRLSQQAGSPMGIRASALGLGRVLFDARRYGPARECFEVVLETGPHPAYAREEAEAAGRVGDLLAREGRHGEAVVLYERALDAASGSGDPSLRARALRDLGRVRLALADFAGGDRALEEARSLCEAREDGPGLAETLRHLVRSRASQGRAREAREALRSLRSTGGVRRGLATMLEGLVLWAEGSWKEAADRLDDGLQILAGTPGADTVRCCLDLARLHGDVGDLEAALHYSALAVQLARRLRLSDLEGRAMALLHRLDRSEWGRLFCRRWGPGVGSVGLSRVTVSALAVELRGTSSLLDRPAPEAARLLDGYFDIVSGAVTRGNGLLVQVLDTRILSVFGSEGTADPEEALECARDVLHRLDLYLAEEAPGSGLGAAAAVAAGEALSGRVGPRDHRETALLGGAAEQAASLLNSAAKGEIRLDRTLGPLPDSDRVLTDLGSGEG